MVDLCSIAAVIISCESGEIYKDTEDVVLPSRDLSRSVDIKKKILKKFSDSSQTWITYLKTREHCKWEKYVRSLIEREKCNTKSHKSWRILFSIYNKQKSNRKVDLSMRCQLLFISELGQSWLLALFYVALSLLVTVPRENCHSMLKSSDVKWWIPKLEEWCYFSVG